MTQMASNIAAGSGGGAAPANQTAGLEAAGALFTRSASAQRSAYYLVLVELSSTGPTGRSSSSNMSSALYTCFTQLYRSCKGAVICPGDKKEC